MKFDRVKVDVYKDPYTWHLWFAWHPVRVRLLSSNPTFSEHRHVATTIIKTRWVWLEKVWRKKKMELPDIDGGIYVWWTHKENINNEVPND